MTSLIINIWKFFTNNVSQIIKPEKASQQRGLVMQQPTQLEYPRYNEAVKQYMLEEEILMGNNLEIYSIQWIHGRDNLYVKKYIKMFCQVFGIKQLGLPADTWFRREMSDPNHEERNAHYDFVMTMINDTSIEQFNQHGYSREDYHNLREVIKVLRTFYNLYYAYE